MDDLILESIVLGATGWVSGLVNAFPRENRLLWDLAAADRSRRGPAEVYRWYMPLLHLDTHPKLVQYIKLAARMRLRHRDRSGGARLKVEGAERGGILGIIRRAIATRPEGRGVGGLR